jgi:hypothetical protein
MHSSAQLYLKAHGGGPPSCVLGVHSIGWFMLLIAPRRLGASLRLVSLARRPLSTPLGWRLPKLAQTGDRRRIAACLLSGDGAETRAERCSTFATFSDIRPFVAELQLGCDRPFGSEFRQPFRRFLGENDKALRGQFISRQDR